MLHAHDIPGFFAEEKNIASDDYLLADYSFETSLEPRLVAASLASESSTAHWLVPGSSVDLRKKFGAKVLQLEVVSESAKPSIQFPWIEGDHFIRCRARLAFPVVNFGDGISHLLSSLAGEGVFYCPGMANVRLEDIHLPASHLKNFEGPRFGIEGLRQILKVHDRPFFVGIVKPNLGLTSGQFAKLAYQAWSGGLDIAKDDEMLFDVAWSGLFERAREAVWLKKKAEEEIGRPKMFLANITDDGSRLEQKYGEAKDAGADAMMVNCFFTGLGGVRSLRKKADRPLMGHFTGMALYDRIPGFGIDGVVSVKLMRLAGCDMIGIPGFGKRMHSTDEIVLKNIRACLEPMGSIKKALPIPGGSDSAETLAGVYAKIGHCDFGFISGRGIFAHPKGPRAGAQSLHEAWEAIQKG